MKGKQTIPSKLLNMILPQIVTKLLHPNQPALSLRLLLDKLLYQISCLLDCGYVLRAFLLDTDSKFFLQTHYYFHLHCQYYFIIIIMLIKIILSVEDEAKLSTQLWYYSIKRISSEGSELGLWGELCLIRQCQLFLYYLTNFLHCLRLGLPHM